MSLSVPAQVNSGAAARVSPWVLRALACPACRGALAAMDARFQCEAPACGRSVPVIDGVPVLIDQTTPLFSLEEYWKGRARVTDTGQSGPASAFGRWMPRLSENVTAEANVERMQRERRGGPSRLCY